MSDVRANSLVKIFSALIITIIISISILSLNCNGDNPATSDNPEIYALLAPDSLVKGIPDTTMIYISASDPQGLADIDSIYFTVIRPDGTSNGYVFYMFDDGVNGGDSLAGDGMYSQGIQSPGLESQTGNYIFRFAARDFGGHVSNIIDKTITAYEYDSPVIRSVVVSQYDAAREHLFLSAAVYDAQGLANIQRVWVEITYLADSSDLGEFNLNDMGISGDSTMGDSRFSLNLISPVDSAYQAGEYEIIFRAGDHDDNEAIPVDTTYIISGQSLLMR